MSVVGLVMNIVALLTRGLIWLILSPFLLCWWVINMWIIRARFRAQLIKAGIRRDVADRMARRYNMSFSDIIRMVRAGRTEHNA